MEPITALLALCERGIALVVERRRQRQTLFNDVVKPIQTSFEEMYRQHMATFAEVQTLLETPDVTAEQLAAVIEKRIRYDAGTIDRLGLLAYPDDDWHEAPSRGDVSDLFRWYVRKVAACLDLPRAERHFALDYYSSLTELPRYLQDGYGVKRANYHLKMIVDTFSSYYADVCNLYAQLQRACLK